jgi:hypothetical protein
VTVDNVPFPANVFGLAVYSKSDTFLQNALVVSPIWAEGYNGHSAEDGKANYVPPEASFIDESPVPSEVKGKLVWQAAKDESRLSGYDVYTQFIDVANHYAVYLRVYWFCLQGQFSLSDRHPDYNVYSRRYAEQYSNIS